MSTATKRSGTKAFVLVASKFVTLLLSMISSMVLARSLNLDEYGTYSELLTVSSIAVAIFSFGLPNALNYFLPRCENEKEKGRFVGSYFALITLLSIILMVIMFFANKPIAVYYQNERLITYSYFIVIIPWTKLIISSRSNLLVAEGKVMREIIYCVLNGAFLSLIALLTMFNQRNFDIYIALYVIVEIIFAIAVYFEAYVVSEKIICFDVKIEGIKELLAYTIPLGLSTAVSTISLDLDKLIIGFAMDEASVAIYANAGKELPFSLISTSFTAVFLPQIVSLVKKKKTQAAVSRWKDIMEINYIMLSFCVAASIVFAPQIISLLYSDAYLDGVGIFRVYSLTLLLRITYWAMFLNAFGKTNEILLNSIICLALNVVLNVLFCNLIGFIGPAIATLISIFAIVVLQIARTSKLLNFPAWSFIPIKRFVLPTVVNVISGIAVAVIVKTIKIGTDTKGIVSVVIIGVVWGLLYLLVYFKKIHSLWESLNVDIVESNVE